MNLAFLSPLSLSKFSWIFSQFIYKHKRDNFKMSISFHVKISETGKLDRRAWICALSSFGPNRKELGSFTYMKLQHVDYFVC